jgi:hypothetical protein
MEQEFENLNDMEDYMLETSEMIDETNKEKKEMR